jgi:hypothetical protein
MGYGRASAVLYAGILALAAGALPGAGQQPPQGQGQTPSPFPLSNPIRERGSSITGAYEGWYRAKDGAAYFLVGYFNRNTKEELDIPVGPNNRIEPGGPDQGQPTHFLPSRQWGVFTIKVPNDFGSKKLTWTLVTNGQTNTITLHTNKDWVVEPFEDSASKNTPPVIRFDEKGPAFTGPPTGIAARLSASQSEPLPLTAWITDEPAKLNVANALLIAPGDFPPSAAAPDAAGRGAAASAGAPSASPAGAPSASAAGAPGRGRGAAGSMPPRLPSVTAGWSVFRGPAGVTFDDAKPSVDLANGGKTTATATFDVPGDYILRLQANDSSGEGGGGFQCCWTNAHVAVTVRPSPAAK